MSRRLVKSELEKIKNGIKSAKEGLDEMKLSCQKKDVQLLIDKINPLVRFSGRMGELDLSNGGDPETKAVFSDILKYVDTNVVETVTVFIKKALKAYPKVFNSGDGGTEYKDSGRNPEEEVSYQVAIESCFLLSTIVNFSDKFEAIQRACCQRGLVTFIFKEMFPLLTKKVAKKGTVIDELTNRCMDIVYNCSKLPENNKYYQDANAVDVLVKIRADTNHLSVSEVNLTALLTLGFLLDESNNDKIVFGQGTVGALISNLKESIERPDHTTESGFHADELAYGLDHISVPDTNKSEICDEGGIEVLADLVHKAKDDKERISSCNALWTLCFSDKAKTRIENNNNLIRDLTKLKESTNTNVKGAAEGVLWQLKHKREGRNKIAKDGKVASGTSAHAGHVMLSYQWDNQDTVKKIAKYLKEEGYNVWIDINNMGENILEGMAHAVEQADVIIVCISSKYKKSANTRAEADYAFQLKKPVIPLSMEKGYIPDGWLGLLLGTKLRLDFTSTQMFKESMKQLCKQMGNRCMPCRAIPFQTNDKEEEIKGEEHNLDHHPVNSTDSDNIKNMNGNRKMMDEVSQWQNNQVVEWLKRNGLEKCIQKDKLKKLTGVHLVMLYKLRKECPKYYYNTTPSKVGVPDLLDFLAITSEIEKLLE